MAWELEFGGAGYVHDPASFHRYAQIRAEAFGRGGPCRDALVTVARDGGPAEHAG